MHIGLLGLLVLSLSTLAHAQDPVTERERVTSLLLEIQAEVAATDDVGVLQQTYAQLRIPRDQLQQTDHRACLAFARAVREKSHDEQSAFRRAIKDCQVPADLPIMRFAFAIYRDAHDDRGALTRALTVARVPKLRGRLAFLKFVFEAWRGSHDKRGALKRAVEVVRQVRRGREGCVRMAFESYQKTSAEASAIRRAQALCQSPLSRLGRAAR